MYSNPNAIAIAANNDVFVADSSNHRVVRQGANGSSPFAWGVHGYFGGVHLNFPKGLAINSLGHVIVADTLNNRIKRFDSSGSLIAMWGYAGYRLFLPYGLAVDTEDMVYVVSLHQPTHVHTTTLSVHC